MSEQTAIFFFGGGWGGREFEGFLPEKTFYQDKRMSLQLEIWERAEKLLMKSKGWSFGKTWNSYFQSL